MEQSFSRSKIIGVLADTLPDQQKDQVLHLLIQTHKTRLKQVILPQLEGIIKEEKLDDYINENFSKLIDIAD